MTDSRKEGEEREMDLGLGGKRAIVTGASRGIGHAVAVALAAEGADVALVARDEAALAAAAARLPQAVRTVPIMADTRDDDSVRRMVASAVAALGGVDILVNAAAKPGSARPPRPVTESDDDDLRVEIETKVLGYLRCARHVAPHLTAQGWGRIINISGLAARQTGNVFGSIRNVAVAALTKNLADELGPAGVNVTAVHPGVTVTERTPAMVARLAEANGTTVEQAQARLASGV